MDSIGCIGSNNIATIQVHFGNGVMSRIYPLAEVSSFLAGVIKAIASQIFSHIGGYVAANGAVSSSATYNADVVKRLRAAGTRKSGDIQVGRPG